MTCDVRLKLGAAAMLQPVIITSIVSTVKWTSAGQSKRQVAHVQRRAYRSVLGRSRADTMVRHVMNSVTPSNGAPAWYMTAAVPPRDECPRQEVVEEWRDDGRNSNDYNSV